MARPREFDPDDALQRAMQQFWAKGYHDTSIRDLVERTGVNYYGLYGVFDSKHGLFLAALDLYRQTVTAEIAKTLRQPGKLQKTLGRTLERVLALMQTPDGRVGCLMCNTAVELGSQDAEAAAKVQAHMALLRAAFEERLTAAAAAGELARRKEELRGLAEFLTTTTYSIGLLVRAGQDDAYIRRHIRNALTVFD